MKRLPLIFILLVLLCSKSFALDFTFDANNEGWKATRIGYYGNFYEVMPDGWPARWKTSLAGRQGVIYQDGTADPEARPYAMAVGVNGPFLSGKTLVTDIYSSGNWQTLSGEAPYVRWYVADLIYTDDQGRNWYNMWVATTPVALDLNSFQGWTTYSIELKEENFFKWPNYSVPGTFQEVLQNYDYIGLSIVSTDQIDCLNGGPCTWSNDYQLLHYGAYAKEGTATWALDNVKALPEPGTLIMVGLGLLTVGMFKRKLGS